MKFFSSSVFSVLFICLLNVPLASVATCDLDWSSVLGLRVNIDDSENCGGQNDSPQNRLVRAYLKGGNECGEYVLAITVAGAVETQNAPYDFVYVNDVLFFQGRQEGGECAMHTATETRQITVRAKDPIVLQYDTVDGLFHAGAYAQITNVVLISAPGCGKDGGCTGCSAAGGGSVGNSSVDVRISLGDPEQGKYPGMFRVKAETPDASIYTPSGIQYGVDIDSTVEVIRDGNDVVRQVLTGQILADVVTIRNRKYEVRFYYAADAGSKNAGIYEPIGSPYRIWTFEDPDNGRGENYRLRVTDSNGGGDTVHVYSWFPANQDWTLVSGGIQEIGRKEALANGDRVKTYWVKAVGGTESYREETRSREFAWGEQIVSRVLDPLASNGGEGTTWTYYTDQLNDGDNYGNPKLMVQSNGYWERYEHDNLGRVIKVVSPVGNAGPSAPESACQVIENIYRDDGGYPQETRIVSQLGQEIERTFTVYSGNSTQRIIAVTPGATWNNATNLVTETVVFGGSGEFKGEMRYERSSDGTLIRYEYARNAITGVKTTIREQGSPDGSATVVVSGTRTTTEEDAYGNLISETVQDIDSGLILSLKIVVDSDELGRPLRIDYLDGTFETFAYNCCGLGTYVSREGIITTYTYDALRRLADESSGGITRSYAYDASGRVIKEVQIGSDHSSMTQLRRQYSPSGRLVWSENALGVRTNYAYASTPEGGDVVTLTNNADGSTQVTTYWRDQNVASIAGTAVVPVKYTYGVGAGGMNWTQTILVGSNGAETQWERIWRDMSGRSIRVEYPDGAQILYSYNGLGQLSAQTDPDGVKTLYAYNDRGELTVTAIDIDRSGAIDYNGSDWIERRTTEVVSKSGGAVIRTSVEYWEEPGVNVPVVYSVIEQAANGLHNWQTSYGKTVHTEITYDGQGGRTETSTSPEGMIVRNTYQVGRLVETQSLDANEQMLNTTTYAYDPHGRLASKTVSGQGETSYTYTNDGQVATVTTPDPDPAMGGDGLDAQITQYTYNSRGWRTKVTHPDGTETQTSYLPTGKVQRMWGAYAVPVAYDYDSQGRLVSMTTWKDYSGETGAATTTWQYDSQRGWLAAKHYADDTGPSYTYTAAGRLASRTWARGTSATYTYDNGGVLTTIAYSDATPGVMHTRDRLGRVSTTTDAAGTLTYEYTNGQATAESYAGSGVLAGLGLGRSLDGFNRISGLTATSVAPVALGYDAAARLSSIAQGEIEASYLYNNSLGLISETVITSDAIEKYRLSRARDNLSRITRVDTFGAGSNLYARRDYAYNDVNLRTTISRQDGRQWDYAYDSLGQVISARKLDNETALPGYAFAFSYDDVGNRMSSTVNDRASDYLSNALNTYTQRDYPAAVDVRGRAPAEVKVLVDGQLAERAGEDFYAEAVGDNATAAVAKEITVKAVDLGPPELLASETRSVTLPKTPEAFTYDQDGNLLQDGLWDYTWDAENRLAAMESRSDLPATVTRKRLEFAYDSQGRRIGKTVKSYAASTETWDIDAKMAFLYDGWNLIAEYDALDANALIRSHVWGIDLSGTPQGAGGVGGLLWSGQSGSAYAPGYDANGNIILWVDLDDGSLAGEAEYGAFGEVLASSGFNGVLPFGFSTKYEDAETQLLYYGYRYYNPGVGRWFSRDPIEEQGGVNLYGMVSNNAISFIDPLGLFLCSDKCSKGERRVIDVGYVVVSIYSRPDIGDFVTGIATAVNVASALNSLGGGLSAGRSIVGAVRNPSVGSIDNAAGGIINNVGSGDGAIVERGANALREPLMGALVAVHTVAVYNECESVSCLVFCKRWDWGKKPKKEYRPCAKGPSSGYFFADSIPPAVINNCIDEHRKSF